MIICTLLFAFLLLESCRGQSFQCGPGETWSDCVSPCNTCKELGRCETPSYCQPGCDCKYGFYRDDTGSCVPQQHCQERSFKCPSNSIFLPCGPACPPTCDNLYGDEDCQEDCSPGCHCRPGFVKRRDGRCVHPNRCYGKEGTGTESCKEGERYYECTPSCKNTCENYNNPGIRCQCGPPGCFCREGLVKRADGKCVRPHRCTRDKQPQLPPKCPKDAVFIECGSPCPPTCDDLNPLPCEQKCVSACYCKPGYLKRKDEKCVLQQQCNTQADTITPAPRKCPANAIYIECGSACPPTCSNRFPEVCGERCVAGCFCIPGFLWKADEAKCVPQNQCDIAYDVLPRPTATPSTYVPARFTTVKVPYCPDNSEYLVCGSACAPNCEKPYMEPCREPCVAGCFCRPGFLKNSRGVCVRPRQCDATCRNPNEEFLQCGTACPDTCDNRGLQDLTSCTKNCVRGCFCRKGLYRTRDGRCVDLQDCRPLYAASTTTTRAPFTTSLYGKKCGANEVYKTCGTACPKTCKNLGVQISCINVCVEGCFCQDGFVKDDSGVCVKPEQCNKGVTSANRTTVDYSRGCPNRTLCDTFCKTQGIFSGVCVGQRRTTCRCL